MRRLLFWLIVVGVVGGAGASAYSYFYASKSGGAAGKYRTGVVGRGDIIFTVPSTGTVQAVQSVQVGAFVSGPIQTVHVDFNAKVEKGQLMAEIDPLLFDAQCSQAKAQLDCSEANRLQAEAKLTQADHDWKRAERLWPEKAISESDYDLARANYDAAVAAVAVAQCKSSRIGRPWSWRKPISATPRFDRRLTAW